MIWVYSEVTNRFYKENLEEENRRVEVKVARNGGRPKKKKKNEYYY